MKDLVILVATHKKYKMPKEDIYLPIHVGSINKEDLNYQKDSVGENISIKNSNYCELTGLYWAWKNLNCNYIGSCHYRRYFTNEGSINSLLNKDNKFNLILSENEIKKLLTKYELILPKKRNYFIDTIWTHYKNAHHIKDLEETKKILEELYPEYTQSFDKVMNRTKLHLYNMFIMNKEDFNNYCEWLFSILFELEKRTDLSNYDDYQKRIFGFISERLFNVWIEQQQFKVKELNITSIEKVNHIKKIVNFVSRKMTFAKG
jgi:Domain of unknown function (DUF4422)